MKKRLLTLIMLAVFVCSIIPTCYAKTVNEDLYRSEYLSGSLGPVKFGKRAATATVASGAYLGAKMVLHTKQATNAPADSCKVLLKFYNYATNKYPGQLTKKNAVNKPADYWFPDSGWYRCASENSFGFTKGVNYSYEVTVTMPSTVEGMYGGFLTSEKGNVPKT